MTVVRISIGGGTLFLSVLGLSVCVAAIIGLWMVKNRAEAVGNAAFLAADESLGFVDLQLDRIRQALDKGRQRVSGISRIAERLRDREADVRQECVPLLETLDEVFQDLKSAQSWLDSSHAVAVGVSKVTAALVSSDYAAANQNSTAVALAQRVQEFSEAITQAIAKLQLVRQEIAELRDSGKLAREVVLKIVAHVADLDGMLARISARIETLDAKVAASRASCATLGQRLHWWTAFAVVTLTVLLAWFAISQIGMAGYGWRLLKAVFY